MLITARTATPSTGSNGTAPTSDVFRLVPTDVPDDVVTIDDYDAAAQAHVDGLATEEQLALLAANEREWILSLEQLLHDAEQALRTLRSRVRGPERGVVLRDFDDEVKKIRTVLHELTGVEEDEEDDEDDVEDDIVVTTDPQLQLTWDGSGDTPTLVAWSAAPGTITEDESEIIRRLDDAGANPDGWRPRDPLVLPDGRHVEALEAPGQEVLGWLVSLAASEDTDDLSPSMQWLTAAAMAAVRLTAQGRMVPQLDKRPTGQPDKGGRSTYGVRWSPALINRDELSALTRALPGVVAMLDQKTDARAFTRNVIGGFVDIMCRDAARRIAVPEPAPRPRSAADVSETVLAKMHGESFDAPVSHGNELSRSLQRWARPVTAPAKDPIVVKLSPPDDGNAWLLQALAENADGTLEVVDELLEKGSNARRDAINRELDRLERLYPIQRASGRRRGEAILSQDEAWELMTTMGPILAAAGFDVRVPPLSRRKAKPGLRLTAEGGETGESAVGASQLTAVSWSAVFDDVELSADDIKRLAKEQRPLVQSHGRWVEVTHADLDAAAKALEEREKQRQMTGADMLRLALGLDDSGLSGGVSLAGKGWAANLLRSANDIPEAPPTKPEGFHGELRSYQADALAWLEFLDEAGLGGCLALDMGLGKTPTMLAHLRAQKGRGPALVIAPPAVVGNWAAEAARFVPGLDVLVHHGQNRTPEKDIHKKLASADLMITTYGTAVRDIGALDEIHWGKVVLDEAQVIKNHTSDTAQQLRRLQARTRVVLTGTPIENGLGDLWSLMDFVNPGLLGERASFIAQLSKERAGSSSAEQALRTLNGVLVFRRTKAEPAIAAELPDRIDELDHCPMTPEQIGLYQAVLDNLVAETSSTDPAVPKPKGAVLAAITALKQICNHPEAYTKEKGPLEGRSGKLARLNEIVDNVFAAGERVLIFTHFAEWGERLAEHLTGRTGINVSCYHGGLARGARDRMIEDFQTGQGPGALVLSLKAGGTGLNLTAANHVVLYDRWWNPAVEDQARDRAWRIGQTKAVVCHRLVCPGTVDERVEEVVAGKRRIANMVLPKSSSVSDLDGDQLRTALGLDPDAMLTEEDLEDGLVSA